MSKFITLFFIGALLLSCATARPEPSLVKTQQRGGGEIENADAHVDYIYSQPTPPHREGEIENADAHVDYIYTQPAPPHRH